MNNPCPIRVLIVDDHDMLREGLIAFLKANPDLKLVGEASNGADAVRLCTDLAPDVVLIDLIMPEMDGVTAITQIHKNQPDIHIIALTSFSDDNLVRSALKAGATSYLLKNISAARLGEAIRATHSGLPTLAPEVTTQLLVAHQKAELEQISLTSREKEVLCLLVKGMGNAQIAQILKISPYTVKNHVSNILSKLNATSRAEVISLAVKKQLVALD